MHIENDAVGDPLVAVGDYAGELLPVGLAAGRHDVAAAHRDRAVGVARLLQAELALQLGLPLDDARRLPVGRHAGGHGHLSLLRARNDGRRGEGHAGHRPR